MLPSEMRDPNSLYDADHVNQEGMRDRAAFNAFIASMESQFGSILQPEDVNGTSIRKSMRSKQKPVIINLVDHKKSYDNKPAVTDNGMHYAINYIIIIHTLL